MKKIGSILLVLFIPLVFLAQTIPIYDKHPSGSPKQNWDNINKYYLWSIDSASTDTTLTSKTIDFSPGFDGLSEFLVQIEQYWDSGDALPDTNYVQNGNITRGGRIDSTAIIVKDTSWVDFTIWFMLQRYYGEPFGWVTEDTLTWVNHTTGVTHNEQLTEADKDSMFYCLADPRRGNGLFWEVSVPKPTRLIMYTTVSDTDRVVAIKLNYDEHLPNRR
jgi:hypothetical protein